MDKQAYEALATDELLDPHIRQFKKRPSQLWSWISLVIACTSGFAISFLLGQATRPSSDLTWDHCGNSSDEARSRGCKFDVLSFAWQIPQCYDEENTEAFLAHQNWTWYTEFHGSETVSEANVRSGNYSAFVPAEYHFVHCTYMLRQLHRAYTIFGYVDDHVDNYNHTLHCQHFLLELAKPGADMTEVNTLGMLRYPICRKIF